MVTESDLYIIVSGETTKTKSKICEVRHFYVKVSGKTNKTESKLIEEHISGQD